MIVVDLRAIAARIHHDHGIQDPERYAGRPDGESYPRHGRAAASGNAGSGSAELPDLRTDASRVAPRARPVVPLALRFRGNLARRCFHRTWLGRRCPGTCGEAAGGVAVAGYGKGSSRMAERWYEKAIIYCLDVETFQDSDGDGVGDFAGLTRRLDYLSRLGVSCLWLNPIHPSPGRDGGYDVADYYNVHPRLGTLGDFAVFLQAAESRGIRVIIDLVVNHTSDEHPWFRAARSAPDSPYRDWYIWSEREPADRRQGIVFPGEQDETWTYDRTARAWYYHRFYRFQPDLNIGNPEVREEIKKIASFWLQLGVAGFRMDAVPFLIESTNPDGSSGDKDFGFLTELRQHVQWQRRDALLLAEANVDPDQLTTYFGDSGGSANRLHMLFDFLLNGQIMLALARRDPEPIIGALRETPALPAGS